MALLRSPVIHKLASSVLALLLLLTPVSQANAASGLQDVTIVQHSTPSSGSFVASGAINDSGYITLDWLVAAAIPSPIVGTGNFVRTFHGSQGTFTIRLQTLLTGTDDPWLFAESGHWVLVDGTGAYAGLLGQGEETGIRDFAAQQLDATYTGKVH